MLVVNLTMDEETLLKTCCKEITDGNFNYVLAAINSGSLKLETGGALKLVMSCCHVCNTFTPNPKRIEEKSLYGLLKYLVKSIKILHEPNLDKYFQSVYYISQLFLKKKCFDIITDFQELYIPEFMPRILTANQYSSYQSICKAMYNNLVRISQSNKTTYNTYLVEVAYLISRMHHKLYDQTNLLNNALNCVYCLTTLGIDNLALYDYYIFVIKLLDRCEKNCVESTYKALLEFFRHNFAHLVKHQMIEKIDHFYEQTATVMLNVFGNYEEIVLLQNALDFCMWISPHDSKQDINVCIAKFKKSYQIYGFSNNFQAVCNTVTAITSAFVQFYKCGGQKSWITHKSHDEQLVFYKFLFNIAQLVLKCSSECSCGCSSKENTNGAAKILTLIAILGKMTIMNECVSKKYKIDLIKYLGQLCDYVSIFKSNNCEKWKNIWYDCGALLYNIGGRLYNANDEDAMLFYEKLTESTIEIEGLEPVIISKQFLNSAFAILSDIYLKREEYETSLTLTAFNIAILEKREVEFVRWIKIKASCRDKNILENTDIQELTVVAAIVKNPQQIERFCPGFNIEIDQKISLLSAELEFYKNKWKSKVPMMAAYRELVELADSSSLVKIFTKIWGDCDLYVHELVPQLLRDTIDKYKRDMNKKKIEDNIYLAHLYYLHHKYRVKDAIIRNIDDINKTLKTQKPTYAELIPADPNDECDIVSSFECLRLEIYHRMMIHLNKAFAILLAIIKKKFSLTYIVSINPIELYKLIKQIAHEFRLHCHSINCLVTWGLALKIARLLNDKILILESISFIIELSDVKKVCTKQLITEADSIVNEINDELAILITYHICKAISYLKYDVQLPKNSFQTAMELYQKMNDCNEKTTIKARLECLHYKLSMLPCKFNVDDHKKYSLVSIHKAVNIARGQYLKSSSNNSSYDMSILFEINEELAKFYNNLRMPREVRCYTKDILIVAQKMVLPLRSLSLLYYLAQADINAGMLDDCRIKIDGFIYILCLTENSPTSVKSPQLQEEEFKFETDIDVVTDGFKEMMLDLPSAMYEQKSLSSPTLLVETFRTPSFFNHNDTCTCFCCMCLEYRYLALKSTFLEALINVHQGNLPVATDYFFGGLKMFEFIKSKEELFENKLIDHSPNDFLQKICDTLMETHCYMLLEYGNTLARSKKIDDAKSCNRKLIDILKARKLEFSYLYNEALVQRLNILEYNIKSNQAIIIVDEIKVNNDRYISKTPEKRESKVTVSPDITPQKYFPAKRVITRKSIKFDLSKAGEKSTSKNNLLTVPNKGSFRIYTKENKNEFMVSSTPKFDLVSAAGPSTPSSSHKPDFINTVLHAPNKELFRNSSRKKKTVLSNNKLSPTLESSAIASNSAFTSTPAVSSPLPSDAQVNLRSRTKLLTDKIKQSNRKLASAPTKLKDENKSDEGPSQKRQYPTIRKNLMGDLAMAQFSSEQNGAIRRSKRNMK